MNIYSVGDEYSGETKFHPSRREAIQAAQGQANHHGHMCHVDKHAIGRTKADLIAFLNYLPVETLHSGESIEPRKRHDED